MSADARSGWRAMVAADLPAVQAVSDAVHDEYSEPTAVYAERLVLYPAGCLAFEDRGALAGYLISHPWHRDAPPRLGSLLGSIPRDPDTYYLHDLALLPSTRGCGAGRAATAFVVAQAAACGRDNITLVAINGADSFWSRQGFDYVAGEAQSSYGSGSHLMRRILL